MFFLKSSIDMKQLNNYLPEMNLNKDQFEDTIYRQAFATAKALCATKEIGVESIIGKTKSIIDGVKRSVEVTIKYLMD